MKSILMFKLNYFIVAVTLFIVEILIALFIDDRFVRPYVGDFLVVILVYSFLRTFIDASVLKLALAALLFSYLVEVLQYLDILTRFGLNGSTLAKTVLGSSFEWSDMLAYTLGIALVLYVESLTARKTKKGW